MKIKMRLKMKNTSHRYAITRPGTRHRHKYESQFNDGYMY